MLASCAGIRSTLDLCSAYMLAAAAFGPLYGKLSNMFGEHNATSPLLSPDRTRAQANPLLVHIHLFGICSNSACHLGAHVPIFSSVPYCAGRRRI